MPNLNLANARVAKNDEFYTQLAAIEQELQHYRQYFRGKVVYCNCDDPEHSNFWRYFADNFNSLGLKKLIATYYSPDTTTYKVTLAPAQKGGTAMVKTALTTNGDFRSPECIELLKAADIVVTNPPFSLFRAYIAQMVKYHQQFILLGNLNAVTYSDLFFMLKANKAQLGFKTGAMEFQVPATYPLLSKSGRLDADGTKYLTVPSTTWFTTVPSDTPKAPLSLAKHYRPKEYPTYVNYDAINVNKVADIPVDYMGAMGVPISFMPKYNPEQFEILAVGNSTNTITYKNNYRMELLDKQGHPTGKFTHNGKSTLYRMYNPKTDKAPAFKNTETGELYSSIYARIIIKRKK